MSIYDCHSHPYVYLGVHKETGQFYIGFRASNKVPALQDLGHKYHTSSKYVTELGFANFEWTILAEFFTDTAADDAYWFEQELISERIEDPLCLNRQYTDRTTGKRKFSMAGHKHNEEYRKRCSERMKGTVMSEEQKLKMSMAHKGKKHTKEQRAKQAASRKTNGTASSPRSIEHKCAMTEGLRKFYDSPENEQARIDRGNKISASKKGKATKPRTVESISKAANSIKKPISCDGLVFPSRGDAAIYFGVRPETISSRVKSVKFPGYFYLAKEKLNR
jgi:hypothetical protein